MADTITADAPGDGIAEAAQLLHDFNVEYDEPTPGVEDLARRLAELVDDGHATVLLSREGGTDRVVGVAVMRVQPSLWSAANEAYLAELYVVPRSRGLGFGRDLITACIESARQQGADYAFLVTSEDDQQARRLYAAAGFRRTEGEGGPLLLAYERDL